MKSTKTNKVIFGKKDKLASDEFDPKHGKFRVTMFISLDVLDEIRRRAKDADLPYQTFLNQELRRIYMKEPGGRFDSHSDEVLDKIFYHVRSHDLRLNKLEGRGTRSAIRASGRSGRHLEKAIIKRATGRGHGRRRNVEDDE
jgi:hypothetical protein